MAENRQVIVDAGAIFAGIDRRDQWHRVAVRYFRELPKPFFTCESAVSEAIYLFGRSATGKQRVVDLLTSGVVKIDFSLTDEIDTINLLMKKYRDVPMSLADACLVRMSELKRNSTVFTFDSDFHIYRRNRKDGIEILPRD